MFIIWNRSDVIYAKCNKKKYAYYQRIKCNKKKYAYYQRIMK